MKNAATFGSNFFETSDLPLATTLCVMGFVLYEIEPRGRRAIFMFTHNDSIDEAVKKYWRKQLLVEPQDFATEHKNLKLRVKAAYSGDNDNDYIYEDRRTY